MNSKENKFPDVIIIGPAHPLRGGLASYDERLAREFIKQGYRTTIFTFSYQYPSILFPGKTQYSAEPAPEGIRIEVKINSINPLNWIRIGKQIRKLKPGLIVVRYWLPFMGPCLGTILRQVKKNKFTRVICIADNIQPHEKRPGDRAFTKYFLKPVDGIITMSEKVLADVREMVPDKPAQFVPHPLYDNFGEKIPRVEARAVLNIPADAKVLLFFGFIRKYKGLDILLNAFKILKQKNTIPGLMLLIAGEFYEDEKNYETLLNDPVIKDSLLLHTHFIDDSKVKNYLCSADCVVQPYRSATQSGVTPLAYHFEIPMIVTNVGGLPSMVPPEVGLVAEPDPEHIAEKIEEFFSLEEAHFLPGIREEKKKYSWKKMVEQIVGPDSYRELDG